MKILISLSITLSIFWQCTSVNDINYTEYNYEKVLIDIIWNEILEDSYLKTGIPIAMGYSSIYDDPALSKEVKSFILSFDTTYLSINSKINLTREDYPSSADTLLYLNKEPEFPNSIISSCKFEKKRDFQIIKKNTSLNIYNDSVHRDSTINIRCAKPICAPGKIFQTIYLHNNGDVEGEILEFILEMSSEGELIKFNFFHCTSCVQFL